MAGFREAVWMAESPQRVPWTVANTTAFSRAVEGFLERGSTPLSLDFLVGSTCLDISWQKENVVLMER